MVFEFLDAVSNGSRGDVELVGGADKALVAGSGLEKAETIEWRERAHEVRSSELRVNNTKNILCLQEK